MEIKEETSCRICDGGLKPVLSLGEFFLSGFLRENEVAQKAPLTLAMCDKCFLVQLLHTVSVDDMYRQYWYRSGLNKSMCLDLEAVVKYAEEIYGYGKETPVLLDIGCNDGTLFEFYSYKSPFKVGFDPARNLAQSSEKRCNVFVNDYFSADKYFASVARPADIVTSIAMFYDLPDPVSFVEDVKTVLARDGIWIIQFTDLYSMLKNNAVDNICHEHLEYYKLSDLIRFMRKCGLEVVDASYNKVNGGSLRVCVMHEGVSNPSELVGWHLYQEDLYLSDYFTPINLFASRIEKVKTSVLDYIHCFGEGDVYALAASTKGNTLLQVLGLDSSTVKAIGEINKEKVGLVTAGTNIPIIQEDELLTKNPKLIIILAWHFVSTFNSVLRNYISNGGIVLFPLPEPYIHIKKGAFPLWASKENQ